MAKAALLLAITCSADAPPVSPPPPLPLAQRIPSFEQRLHSSRQPVRYALLAELTARDAPTRQALQTLAADQDPSVASQALIRYAQAFVQVDKKLFTPAPFLRDRFASPRLADLPPADIVDYLAGRKPLDPETTGPHGTGLLVLTAASDDPAAGASLQLLGLFGSEKEIPLVEPYLVSTNDYVALQAAIALIRLGSKDHALQALADIARRDPLPDHLFYITESLYALREMKYPGYPKLLDQVIQRVDKADSIPGPALTSFLLLAAQTKPDVWK